VTQADDERENAVLGAADLEGEARSYESAADQAARAGHERRARQFLQSARASRNLAAEIRQQAPALLVTLKERADAARRRSPISGIRDPRRKQRQLAEQEWVVRRWLNRLRAP
jgi:hypothetical protein